MEKNKTSIGEGKRKFFQDLAAVHFPEMKLLIRGGKLSKKDNWRNVAEHCLVQVAVVDELAVLLKLSLEDRKSLNKVALCHDWKKRLTSTPDDFTNNEKIVAQKLLARVNPDKNLMEATDPGFIEKALIKNESSFLERIQFYVDDIVSGSNVLKLEDRLSEVESRRQDLNEDVTLTNRLGGKYWDKERELGKIVEKEIFEKLSPETQREIQQPENIPSFLESKISEKW